MSYNRLHILLFLAPIFIIVLLLYGMIAWTMAVSMDNWVGMAPVWKFNGLQNYVTLFRMERFWGSLRNNLTWMVAFIIPSAMLGLVLAYGLVLSGRAESLFRPLFLYPLALSFVVTGTLWAWMYDPEAGVINNILKSIGLGSLSQPWIASPRQATFCLIGAAIWQYTGFAMTLYLAAIRDIPGEIFEAAKVDGASDMQIFRHVVVPNVTQATMVTIAMMTIFSLKVFDLVWVITFGGPGTSTEVLGFFMFVATYRQQFVGLGAAISVIILILAAAVVVPYAWWSMKKLQT
ncbi:MAG: sugar ABC transporter permease [Anaerolineae bacterium]|nr:sugar ABC transporter permease [Anaerolineae bacterium]